ncbi:MAG: thioesterase family protein [Bacteroidales bacterium]|jgi:predicted thioesterase|nr:thioesterase family protein [Bacteroidales bacterium]
METKIPRAQVGEKRIIVQEKDTAKVFNSGLVEVFATPAMIALMEEVAHNSIQGFLPNGITSVGSLINVKHIKATPVGMEVYCKSIVTSIEGRKIRFLIEAFDERGQIGEAFHERVLVNAKEFLEKTNKKAQE